MSLALRRIDSQNKSQISDLLRFDCPYEEGVSTAAPSTAAPSSGRASRPCMRTTGSPFLRRILQKTGNAFLLLTPSSGDNRGLVLLLQGQQQPYAFQIFNLLRFALCLSLLRAISLPATQPATRGCEAEARRRTASQPASACPLPAKKAKQCAFLLVKIRRRVSLAEALCPSIKRVSLLRLHARRH